MIKKKNIKDACPFPPNKSPGFNPFKDISNSIQSTERKETDIMDVIDSILSRSPTILFASGLIAFLYGYWIGDMSFVYAGATLIAMSVFILRFDLLSEVGVHTRSNPLTKQSELTIFSEENFITKQDDWKSYNSNDFLIHIEKVALEEFLEKIREIKKNQGFSIVNYDPNENIVWLKTQEKDNSVFKHTPEGMETIWAKYS